MTPVRTCPCCKLPLPEDAHAARVYCDKPRCQLYRRSGAAKRHAIKVVKSKPLPVCQICGNTFQMKATTGRHSPPKSCYNPACRLATRQRATSEAVRHRREQYRKVSCLRCIGNFLTALDGDGIPLNRICPTCHHNEHKDEKFRWGEVWG